MNRPQDFDRLLGDWLEETPPRTPDDVLGTIAASLPSIPQRGARRIPWRIQPMFGLSGPGKLAAASIVVVLAIGGVAYLNAQRGIEGPAAPLPTSAGGPEPTASPSLRPASGGMWPQSTLEEVRSAQERADTGDPAYTWQVGARLVEDGLDGQVDSELIDRFLREALGWEDYLFHEPGQFSDYDGFTMNGWADGTVTGQRYLRCGPGRTNPLYPPQPDSADPGQSCAPTIDDLHYETVSFDMAQLARQGRDGIWVVSRWGPAAPFAQVDPAVAEAQATERLEAFLAARVAGNGAEEHLVDGQGDVPLLYATSSGAAYERFAFERVDGPRWPDGRMTFSARLFTDDGATVVEQQIRAEQGGPLWLDAHTTTRNGQPITLSYTSEDREVSLSAPSTWDAWLPGRDAPYGYDVRLQEGHVLARDVWSGQLWRVSDSLVPDIREHIALVDPVAYDAWCAANGGSPLLSAPADAAEIARQVVADPNFEATAPVAVRVGGLDAISIDVALAPGGKACGIGMTEIGRWIHSLGWEPGLRLRLYLVDLPKGMSVETLAITVQAPKDRFEDVIAETAPIIESIEFHPRGTTRPTLAP